MVVLEGRAVSYERSGPVRGWEWHQRTYLTECVYLLVLESQLPHKIVHICGLLLMEVPSRRFCGGVDFLDLSNKHIVPDKSCSLLFAYRFFIIHRQSPLGPVDSSFRALSGRLKLTVRRHKSNKDSSPRRLLYLSQKTSSKTRFPKSIPSQICQLMRRAKNKLTNL